MARSETTTKYEIIQVASEYFFEVGYSATSPKMIAEKLRLSTGNITYYFKTKEHLLLEIVKLLCDFQWKMLDAVSDGGYKSSKAIGLELMTVATACAENEIARDFFVATFQSEICRNYLRDNHVERAKRIFKKQMQRYTDEQFHEAEILVMGLQYATVIATDADVTLEARVRGALNQILSIYNVDEQTRKKEIEVVLAMNDHEISKQVLKGFKNFVKKENEHTLEEMI